LEEYVVLAFKNIDPKFVWRMKAVSYRGGMSIRQFMIEAVERHMRHVEAMRAHHNQKHVERWERIAQEGSKGQ
jgi:hypothetical protein